MSQVAADNARNGLQFEKSPYLLQHAANPVNWHPWGETALRKARDENKPIFISIGYATCHWCHVMAEESFSDDEVAARLNHDFVSIKVDREERPDLDNAFMHACQLLNGHGGWPLNLFLSPAAKPFYALTYAPKHSTGRHPGFLDIIDKVAELWREQPDNLLEAGEQLSAAVRNMDKAEEHRQLREDILERAADGFRQQYDADHGGFGAAPKFPQPHNASLLLRLAQRLDDGTLQKMALTTLKNIDQGGITDQLGGGIHRYSVDRLWHVPHFEKMLYDQALISEAYLDAWQVTGDPLYSYAARHILDYVLERLTSPQGGFYCGEDADSEGAEGTYYLWRQSEFNNLLDREEFELFADVYSLTAVPEFDNRILLQRQRSFRELADSWNIIEAELQRRLDPVRQKLLVARSRRPAPALDDKILCGWNGLMISALARAGRLLDNSVYRRAARRAAGFIREHFLTGSDLRRRYREGETAIDGFHEDYAYLIRGLIELFLADAETADLRLALDLMERCEERFGDGQGGYFDTAETFADGLGRGRSRQDGALPAAASVTAHNLIRLARLTGNPQLEERARTLLSLHLTHADEHPTGFACLLQALDLSFREGALLVIVPGSSSASPERNWRLSLQRFRPHLMALVTATPEALAEMVPATAGKSALQGMTTAWLCSGTSCQEPVTDPIALDALLNAQLPLKTFSR